MTNNGQSTIGGRAQIFGRLNQSYALLEQIYNANSCEWIELESALDEALLLEAIKLVIDRHPMARSVYRRRWFWFQWLHTQQQLPITIEHQHWSLEDDDSIREAMLENIKEYRVLREDQHPFRFILIRTDTRFFLQIMTSHVYTDGRSANIFTSELVDCYSHLESGRDWDKPIVDIAERNHDKMFLASTPLPKRAVFFVQAFFSLLKDTFTPAGGIRLKAADRSRSELLLTHIPPDVVEKAKGLAKANGVTFHPVMLVALSRMLESFNANEAQVQSRSMRIVDNFSLRRFSSDANINDLYDCVAVPYTLDVKFNDDNASMLENFNQQLDEMKEGVALRELYKYRFYHWMSLLLPKGLAATIAIKLLIRANVICTNVGVLSDQLTSVGSVKVKHFMSFPPLFPPGDIMFQFSSFAGDMRLITLYHPNQLSREDVQEKIVNRFIEALRQLPNELMAESEPEKYSMPVSQA